MPPNNQEKPIEGRPGVGEGDGGRPTTMTGNQRSGRRNTRGSRKNSSRRSFLTRMGESFKRSGGLRGADVDTLRGTQGADFEGRARVVRGEAWGDCPCCVDKDEVEDKVLLIKGTFCFVFYDDGDLAPKYAISLTKLIPMVRDGGSGGRTIVTLETKLGDVEYEISFEETGSAKLFRDAVARQAAMAKAEIAAKKRGQSPMLTKNSSVRYAEAVAMRKVQDQPEKETGLTSEDVAMAAF